MSAMNDLWLEIADLIEAGMSDSDISNRLHIEVNWVNEVRAEYEKDIEDDGQPTWEQEWADFGECYD